MSIFSKLSLKQAAEFAETTKPTILKHMAKGKVSGQKDENGQWWFDMAELVRAYGELGSRNTPGNKVLYRRNPHDSKMETLEETGLTAELAAVKAQLALVEQERERERRDKDGTIADLRARLDKEADDRRRLMTLLTDQRPQPEQAPPPAPRGWRGWFRGQQ